MMVPTPPMLNPSNITSSSTPTQLLASQSSVTLDKVPLSNNAAVAITGVTKGTGVSTTIKATDVVGINSAISGIGSQALTIENAFASTGSSLNSATKSLSGSINTLTNSANKFLQDATKSISGTFSKAAGDLAKGIDSALDGIFKNTNIKTASTTNTKISDPVKTNLLSLKPPSASVFKISSLEAGSQVVSMNGISTQFGSMAKEMVGTDLSTLLNRLNIDSVNALASGISNDLAKAKVGGLLSDVSNFQKDITKLTGDVRTATSSILNSDSTALRGISNDVQTFLGRTGNLQQLTGISAIDHFVSDGVNSLRNSLGLTVDTRGSGVDSNTANSLLDLARRIGCDVGDEHFDSENEINSIFNMLMSLASQFNMDNLLDSLLGCNQAATDLGQDAIIYSFDANAGRDVTVADKLLDNISNPALLDSEDIYKKIVTNPNLSVSDIGTVSNMTTKLGRSVQDAYSLDTISSDSLRVYDIDTVAKSNTNFVNGVFGDTTLSTYCQGTEMSLGLDGTMGVWT